MLLIVQLGVCFFKTFKLFYFPVGSAKVQPGGGFFTGKADPYLELSVDGQPPRKTEVIKKSWVPNWNEHFTV
jgi:hypothetical protein